jgi:Kef-type K+ transport system membrane component KefB
MADMLLPLALVLIAAEVGAALAHAVRLPRVVGQIGAGIVIGPSVFNLVADGDAVKLIAELGALAILGTAGLETNLAAMRKVGRPALLAAIGGVILPFILGLVVSEAFGLDQRSSLFVAATLTATSVGITAATLQSLGLINGTAGMAILGAAVIDDILGLVVLALVVADAGGGSSPLAVIAPMTITIVGAALALRYLTTHLHSLLHHLHLRGEGGLAAALGFVLLVAWIFQAFGGLAGITGAYVAGLALSGSTLAERMKDGFVRAGETLSVPVFFASIGLAADLHEVPPVLPFALVLLGVAVMGKVVGCGLGARLGGLDGNDAGLVGMGMVGRGEVALVAATVGLNGGAIDQSVYAAVVLLALATTVLAPILVVAWARAGERIRPTERAVHGPAPVLLPVRVPQVDGE